MHVSVLVEITSVVLEGGVKGTASVVGCRFASNPIDIEENTAGHLLTAECWPLDGSFPHLYLTLHRHPMKVAGGHRQTYFHVVTMVTYCQMQSYLSHVVT